MLEYFYQHGLVGNFSTKILSSVTRKAWHKRRTLQDALLVSVCIPSIIRFASVRVPKRIEVNLKRKGKIFLSVKMTNFTSAFSYASALVNIIFDR